MGHRENMQASTARRKAERFARKAAKLAAKNPEKSVELEQRAESMREEAERITALGAKRDVAKQEAKVERAADKAALHAYRDAHPLEKQLNQAATLKMWPSATLGRTRLGPISGGHAELFNADAHKAWTATRLGAGAATGGMSLVAGRKNKGAAAINVAFGNGAAQ
jgi:hypothetical protein